MAIKVSALNVLYKFELHRLQEQGSYSLDDAPLVVIDLWQKWELAATSTEFQRLTRAVRWSNEIKLEETRIRTTLPFDASGSASTREGSVSQLEFVERELVEWHFTASTSHFCGPSSAVESLATGGSNCSLESCDADTPQREVRTIGIEIGICKNVIRALMHSIEMPFGMQ